MKFPDHYIEALIKEIAGNDTVALVLYIKDKKNVSEFKIAEKLHITVNQVRNMLYRLDNHSLVSFTRKKDKKKGWYIYFWTFEMAKAKNLMLERIAKKIEAYQKNIEMESRETFYKCPNKCMRTTAVNALEFQFKCPECDTVLVQEDNTQNIEKLKNKIVQLEKERIDILQYAIAKDEKEKDKKPKKELKKKVMKQPQKKKPEKKQKRSKKIIKKQQPQKKKPIITKAKEEPKKKGFLGRLFKRS